MSEPAELSDEDLMGALWGVENPEPLLQQEFLRRLQVDVLEGDGKWTRKIAGIGARINQELGLPPTGKRR
jgi:hypothetical protein